MLCVPQMWAKKIEFEFSQLGVPRVWGKFRWGTVDDTIPQGSKGHPDCLAAQRRIWCLGVVHLQYVGKGLAISPFFHGCCWETFYMFAYCGLVVGIPTELLRFEFLLPKPNVKQGYGCCKTCGEQRDQRHSVRRTPTVRVTYPEKPPARFFGTGEAGCLHQGRRRLCQRLMRRGSAAGRGCGAVSCELGAEETRGTEDPEPGRVSKNGT